MSALEQRRHTHLARPRARHLVSDDDLRHLIGRRQTTALHVMLYVRKRAVLKGRLNIAVTNVELERELGVDRRQIQRAKAHLREVGFEILERTGRHQGRTGKSGSLACMFVLDRREVEPLKARLELVRTEDHGGAVLEAVHVREENTPPESATTSKHSLVGWPAAARAGPLPTDGDATSTSSGEPATAAQPWLERPRAASPERLPGLPAAAEFVDELTHLRKWWTAAREPRFDGERAAAVLDRAAAAWIGEGGSPFTIRLARSHLERELGLNQLSLADDGDVSRLPHTRDEQPATAADTPGSGAEGTSSATTSSATDGGT